MKNIPPTPSSPGFLSQQNHHSWFLEKPPETFWAKHASASMRISGAGVLLHCPAARKLCSRGRAEVGGRGAGLRRGPRSVVTATARPSRRTWQELSPPQFTGADPEARGGRVTRLPSSLEPGLLGNTNLVLPPAQSGVRPESLLRVLNPAFSLLCGWGSELPCARPLLLALFSSLKEASASETSLCPQTRPLQSGEREREELLLLDAGWNFTGSLGL